MIQRFRSTAFALLAILGGFCFFGQSWAAPLEAVRYVTAYDAAGHGYAEAKYRAEVASQLVAESDTETALRSDLRRDSHGFRMASVDDLEGIAPA